MSDIVDTHEGAESKKSVQICEDPNSKAHLEALFNVLNNANGQEQKSQGFRGRKLPDSFFSPSKLQLGPSISVGPSTGASAQHMRSMSMPASFPETHSGQYPVDNAVHGAIPPGWEMARTPEGVSYFIDHNTKTTTWEDPRKAIRMGHSQVHPQHNLAMPPYPHAQPLHLQQQNATPNQSMDSIPLPEGWQKAFTSEGEPYYVNHKNRTTSWFHPSLPKHHHSYSYAGSRPGVAHGNYQNFSPQQNMSLHPQLPMDKRVPYDSHHRAEHVLQQQQANVGDASHVPATLYNDPYLSSNNHIRQASHDSGLGVTAMPYQSEVGMDFDENMDTGHSSLNKLAQNRDYLDIDADALAPEQPMQEQMDGDLLGRWV